MEGQRLKATGVRAVEITAEGTACRRLGQREAT